MSNPPTPATSPATSPAADGAPAAPAVASALYREMVLIDRRQHARLRAQPVRDWRIASTMNAVLCTAGEFVDAAREFAIAFVPTGQGPDGKLQISPVVLLGLSPQQNLYVTAEGRWDAAFVPAFLRRYPFAYVLTEGERYSLAADVSWSGLNETEGEPLLTSTGEPTEFLQRLMTFLDQFEAEAARTRVMCERLVALNLLRSGEINGQLADGTPVKAEGFFMVDQDKLRALPDAEVLELHRNGMLGLLHTHLLSMGNVQALAGRLGQQR